LAQRIDKAGALGQAELKSVDHAINAKEAVLKNQLQPWGRRVFIEALREGIVGGGLSEDLG